jgi:DNA polymerase-1
VSEAAGILDAYFEAFPNVKQYMDDAIHLARQTGYTETLFGRRRHIEELMSDNFRVRQAGERQAMNAAIQGLAADIFKIALVRIDKALVKVKVQSRVGTTGSRHHESSCRVDCPVGSQRCMGPDLG